MSDLKISELEDGVSAQAGDALPIARGGQNYYITAQYLKNFVFGSNGTIAVAAGKTFSVNNTITLNGNDGVSVNFGSGGTFLYDGGPLGIPSSGTMTNVTGLPLTSGVTGTLAIANGGTGQTTANAAFNALVPSQTGNNGKYLTTDGSNTSWATNPLGTVTSVDVSGGTTGLSFSGGPVTTSGTITMAGTLAVASGGTGITSFGAGVATWLGTPSSANLAAAVADETGSGALVFGTSPTLASPTVTTPSITSPTITGTATFNGSASGTVSLRAPAVAGTTSFQLPGNNGTSGYVLVTDGLGNTSWAASGGAAGNAAGINKNIQFNDATVMAGAGSFNFDKTTNTVTLGVVSSTTGTFALANSGSAYTASIKSGVNSADWTLTLPTTAGTNGQALTTDGSGNATWTTIQSGLTVGSTAISGGTSGRILYDNAGVLGELALGNNVATFLATPTSANLAAAVTDETGTGSLVFSNSPTLVTPILGTPSSGNLANCTFPALNQNTTGTAAGLSATLAVTSGGTGTGTAFTAGSVVFAGASGVYAQDNSQLFWDNTNSRLGIGTATPAGPLQIGTAMTLDASGNLGIGTASPGKKLDVAGGALRVRDNQILLSIGTTQKAGFTTYDFISGSGTDYSPTLYAETGLGMYFLVNGSVTKAMTLDASGNLLVGTTTSQGRFTVKSAAASGSAYVVSFGSSTTDNILTLRDDGLLGTGTATNSPYNYTTASGANLFVNSGGNFQRSTSSLRYKTNVETATHGLKEVLELRPVTYNGKNDGDVVFGGLIAEEVDAVGLKEFVVYDDENRPDALAYGNMVSLAFKAIQELAAKVAELEVKI